MKTGLRQIRESAQPCVDGLWLMREIPGGAQPSPSGSAIRPVASSVVSSGTFMFSKRLDR